MRPLFRAGLTVTWFAPMLIWGVSVAAQDTVYSHWPAVQHTAFDPAKREPLFQQVKALLAKPIQPASERFPTRADGDKPGWTILNEARRLLQQRDFREASQRAEQVLATARKQRDRRLEMLTLGTIGGIAREVFLGASLKAVPFHEEALAIALELQDSAVIISQLLALADNYGQAGRDDSFLEYLGRAAEMLNRFDQPISREQLGVLFACFLETDGELVRAEKMFRSTILLARKNGDTNFVQHLYWQLFWLYLSMSDVAHAEAVLDTVQITGLQVSEEELYEPRYQLEKLRGNREQAFRQLEKAYQFLGAQYSRRSAEQLAGWETRLHTREQQLQLEAQQRLLNEQKRGRLYLYGLMALVSVLLLVSLLSWYYQRQAKRALHGQNQQIEKQSTELRQLDQLKSRFFANVSHELRTPLTLILGPIGKVLKSNELNRNDSALLETAQRNARQLLNLVNEILDLSKLRATRSDLQEQPTLLFDFLKETTGAFQPLAESRKVNLCLEYTADKSWTLVLDRQKLLKIINNLLSNALKFAPCGSTVALHAERRETEALLRVCDAGPGIHPDDLPHIFDLYYQSKRPEAMAGGGTGIGLTLSRELAQVMGGHLRAESMPGEGSTFFLTLPVKERPPEEAVPVHWGRRHTGEFNAPLQQLPAAQTNQPISEFTARLLVVEDNSDLQEYLRAVLPADYHLTIADNGRAALDYLESTGQVPDLLLSDVMMPFMDGFQLVENLRASDPWRGIPVILLTALAERDDRLRAFRIGIDDYMIKPFSIEELLVRIENALRNQAARREWMATRPAYTATDPETTDTWLRQLEEKARNNLGNPQFTVDHLAFLMNIGRNTLYRLVREKTGLSPNQLIQELRLLQAREMLESGQFHTLRQVADTVGFRSADYFSRLYRERFGKSPAEYL